MKLSSGVTDPTLCFWKCSFVDIPGDWRVILKCHPPPHNRAQGNARMEGAQQERPALSPKRPHASFVSYCFFKWSSLVPIYASGLILEATASRRPFLTASPPWPHRAAHLFPVKCIHTPRTSLCIGCTHHLFHNACVPYKIVRPMGTGDISSFLVVSTAQEPGHQWVLHMKDQMIEGNFLLPNFPHESI